MHKLSFCSMPFSLRICLPAIALFLTGCGDGYSGHFVWGNQPDDDDPGLVVVVTRVASYGEETAVSWDSQSAVQAQNIRSTSVAAQAAFAQLQTTDTLRCDTSEPIWRLTLQVPDRQPRHYLSSHGACAAFNDGSVAGWIATQELAAFAQLLSQKDD
ncbi:hypothetical protein E9531_13990 [Lampropedia puyangensis]|uniref:Lipoprotein n=1 Tax=Lampropedia puyangensis TaxID=1330072 RepID=A0A4S8EWK5_9BURK|nr:hypothetical protein [Lampropedia puyangensis]THT98680.1 hypothetical protein E9531_13990 [Lampropedia puyangensis]